jgi:hypothetical protein
MHRSTNYLDCYADADELPRSVAPRPIQCARSPRGACRRNSSGATAVVAVLGIVGTLATLAIIGTVAIAQEDY